MVDRNPYIHFVIHFSFSFSIFENNKIQQIIY